MKYIILFTLFLVVSSKSFADQVNKVDGKKVFFDITSGGRTKVGDSLYILDSRSQKIGIISVTAVKGNRGLGVLKKGKAIVGNEVALKQTGRGNSASVRDFSGGSGSAYGFLVGFNSQSLTLKSGDSSASFSGSNPSLGGFYERTITSNIKLRFLGEYLIFNVSTSIADTKLAINVSYLSLQGLVDYYLNPSFWVGFGFSFMTPLSKSAYTGYQLDNISAANTLGLYVGYDLRLSKKNFIPLSLSYAMFAGGESASMLGVKAGYGWNF